MNVESSGKSPHKGSSSEEIDLLAQESASSRSPGVPRELGDFRIIEKIASGGMATVYEAEQISLKRRVALKILPSHLADSAKAVRRFQREAEAGGRQSHPAIVSIYAVGEHDGTYYIAEELVEKGLTLADHLKAMEEKKDLPVGHFRKAAALVATVAEALEHAHASGVIHRDVKPTNILVTADGRPKVTDFGLAKVQDALSLSRTGEFMGTPFYMSPEQALSRRIGIDRRTDIYSLGVTLYESITLTRPFEGKTSHEILKKIIFHEPSDPCKVSPRLPRDLAIICLKAMEKKPSQRYQTMGELADDLRRFLNGEVILAKPAGLATRLAKRIRRHPKTSFTAAVILVALIVMGINGLWFLSELSAERKKTAAVNEFLASIFLSPDPNSEGKDVKVVDFLAKAVADSEKKFKDQPAIRAMLLVSIADVYESLGVLDVAEKCYGQAVEIRRETESADHPDTLTALAKQANVLIKLGEFSSALERYDTVLATWSRDPGPEAADTLDAMEGKAKALLSTGALDEAEAILRGVHETRQRILPAGDEDLLRSKNNLGCFLMKYREDLDMAESLLLAAVDGRRETLGLEHTDTLQSMTNLARLYKDKRMFAASEKLSRDVLAIQSRILSPRHPDLLRSKNNLAVLLITMKQFDEALALLEETLDSMRAQFGESHPETLDTISNLAFVRCNMKDLDEEKRLFREVANVVEKNPDRDYVNKHLWFSNLAQLCKRRGKYADAEVYSNKALHERSELYGAEHIYVLRSVTQLASILLRSKKTRDAAELLGNYDASAIDAFSKENPYRIDFHDCYTECLIALEEFAGAADQALICLNAARASERHEDEKYIKLLVYLYTQAGRPEEAAKYRALAGSAENG